MDDLPTSGLGMVGRAMAAPSTTAVDRAVDGAVRRLDTARVLLSPRFTGTWSLVAITVVFYALEALAGGTTDPAALTRLGALRTDLVLEQGEWFRILCPMFLHYGIVHLLMNGVALVQLAAIVESIAGSARMVTIYLVCGVAAALASALFNDPLGNASVGASGAIMGLAGLLVGWALYGAEPLRTQLRQLLLRRLMIAVTLTFALGIAVWLVAPVIDNWAHLGGFVAGLVAAGALRDPVREAGSWAWGSLGASVAMVAFAWGAMSTQGARATATLHDDLATAAWRSALRETDGLNTASALARLVMELQLVGDRKRALTLVEQRLAAMRDPATPATLATLLHSLDTPAVEQAAYRRWVELAPDDAAAWNGLAWTTIPTDPQRAVRLADRALSLLPPQPEPVLRGAILETHAQALRHSGEREQALAEQREAVELLRDDWWIWALGELEAVEQRLVEMEAER